MVDNFLYNFFENYKDVGLKAIKARQNVCVLTKKSDQKCDEIDIDVLLPFLLPIEESLQFQIAHLLGACRDIIDCQNRGKLEDLEVVRFVRARDTGIKILSLDEYLSVNKQYRRFVCSDLTKSYIASTKRVYYRADILSRHLKGKFDLSDQVLNSVRMLSAFLLFDDDFFDLEQDLANKKKTILTQYLFQGGEIGIAIRIMTDELSRSKILLSKFKVYNDFLKGFVNAYFP